jgi:hypothetical protein
MSDESLTNPAVEWVRAAFLFMNVMERDVLTDEFLTDDFVVDDRRSGINYGIIDAATYVEVMRMYWELGSGRPTWTMPEVIAVRGQRIAAFTSVNDFGNDMHLANINCVCLDPQLRLQQRLVFFDVDARDAAIAEVDRMHAEVEAGDA